MVRIMSNKNATNRIIEAATHVIIAESHLNQSMIRAIDRCQFEMFDEKGKALIEAGSVVISDCVSAALNFEADADEEKLHSSLLDIARRFSNTEELIGL
jgi:hypothetical protein